MSGADECTDCFEIIDTYQNSTDLSQCLECPLGWISDIPATSCTECPAGSIANTDDTTLPKTCRPCPEGKYNTISGMSNAEACLSCPIGRYLADSVDTSDHNAIEDCLNCTAGTYNPRTGKGQCFPCAAVDTPPGAIKCGDQCDVGTFRNTSFGKITCVDCAPGLYAHRSNMPECKSCLIGRYSSQPKSTNCEYCDRGM